jgi:hypothetical protein
MTRSLTNLVAKFHNDEEGLESLQVVMIIAIAAMILIAAAIVGKSGVEWMEAYANPFIGSELEDITPPTGGVPVEELTGG